MIGYFLKTRYRQDLASCAIVFSLFAVISLSMPLFGYLFWKTVVPPDSSEWVLGAPFWLWVAWIVKQWFVLVKIVRAEPQRSISVAVFHVIQAVFLGGMLFSAISSKEHVSMDWLPVLIICAEVPTVIFLLNYLLLAVWTRTRPSWHAVSALALGISSLAYEIWSANRPVR